VGFVDDVPMRGAHQRMGTYPGREIDRRDARGPARGDLDRAGPVDAPLQDVGAGPTDTEPWWRRKNCPSRRSDDRSQRQPVAYPEPAVGQAHRGPRRSTGPGRRRPPTRTAASPPREGRRWARAADGGTPITLSTISRLALVGGCVWRTLARLAT
jgi:hypothetical protein